MLISITFNELYLSNLFFNFVVLNYFEFSLRSVFIGVWKRPKNSSHICGLYLNRYIITVLVGNIVCL